MRRATSMLVALAISLAGAVSALAYFTTTGAGAAQASLATMSAPSNLTVQQTGSNITISWSAATLSSGGAVQGYRVKRSDGTTVCGSPTLVTTLSCTDSGVPVGTYTYTVSAIYNSWDSSTTSSSITVLTAPTIGSTPSNPSANSAPSFSFSGGNGTSYQCQLDGGSFAACSSPKSYSALAAGSHTFKVHAAQGSSTGPDTTYTWTIDTSAPTISATPPSQSASSSASFSFSHAESAYTFKCQMDGGGFTTCTSPKAYSSLSDATHTFQVEAIAADGSSTAVASYSWLVDTTPPTQSLALAGGATGAYLGGSTLYYKGNATGSFQLVDTESDSGSGPASAAYPAIATTGWTHAAETVTTPTGGPYTSSAFTWSASPTNPSSYTVTAKDNVANASTSSLTFANDTTAPSGGALTVNGKVASGADPISYSNTLSFAVGGRTDYTEPQSASQSGLASSTLTVQSETETNGTCGAPGSAGPFTTPTTITGTTQPSGIVTGYCYVYTLTGTDHVGNTASISTTVEVDTTPPTNGLSLTVTSGGAYLSGTTVYYLGGPGKRGALTITNTVGAESGAASSIFGSLGGTSTGWTSTGSTVTTPSGGPYVSNSFSWTQTGGGTTSSPTETIAGADNATNTTNTTLTLVNDNTPPSGGTVSYANGFTAGPVSVSFTPGTDGQSGINTSSGILLRASATFSGGSCGTFGAFAQVGSTGMSSPYSDATVAGGNCYEYEYTVADNVGNTATYTSSNVLEVDTTPPTQSVALAGGATGAYLSGGTLFYKGNASGSFQLIDTVTDSQSGPASASFPNISTTGWTHAAETVTAPAAGPYTSSAFTWSANPSSNPSSYSVTGADNAGNTATTTAISSFVSDTTAPTGGALSVNGTAASGSNPTSDSTSVGFTIGARTDYSETQTASQSGLQSSTLTVQSETFSGGSCGAVGSGGPFTTATTVTGTTQPSGIVSGYCYLYKLTGTDNVGNAASISTTVEVDATPPTGGTVSYTNGDQNTTSVSVSFTQGTDSNSGLNASSGILLRASATLSSGSCGTFGSFTSIATNPSSPYTDSGLSSGNCYEYEYKVADNFGNVATYASASVVGIDTTPPTQSLAVAGGTSDAYLTGTRLYYKGNASGSVQLVDTVTDSLSGPASASFPTFGTTGWTHSAETITTPASGPYTSSAISWNANPTNPSSYTVTGADAAGNTTTTTINSLVSDTTAPTGGALAVNGTTATGAGSTSSINNSTSFTIGSRTDYAETQSTTQSGLKSSTLTVQSESLSGSTCGAPGSGGPFTTATTITGTTQPSGIAAGYCYLYKLTGTDNVGNAASVSTTVTDNALTFAVTTQPSSVTAGTATAGTAVILTAKKNGATDTTYTGATLTWGGANNSPSAATPTLPTSPTWTSGTATFGITLVKAESETLTVTDGTRSGTFTSITVNAGAAAKLAWTGISTTTTATMPSPCFFTCTYTSGFGNAKTWTASVSVTDTDGNTVSSLGGSATVTLSGSGSTSPASPATLTIPASGAAQTTSAITFTSKSSGSYTGVTLTATDSTYGSAVATFNK